MKTNIVMLLCVSVLVLKQGMVFGYEVATHDLLSKTAAEISHLQSTDLLSTLGLTIVTKFKNTNGDDRNIVDLIGDGARFEDDVTLSNLRPLNHFFNPLNGAPLTVPGLRCLTLRRPGRWKTKGRSMACWGSASRIFRTGTRVSIFITP